MPVPRFLPLLIVKTADCGRARYASTERLQQSAHRLRQYITKKILMEGVFLIFVGILRSAYFGVDYNGRNILARIFNLMFDIPTFQRP